MGTQAASEIYELIVRQTSYPYLSQTIQLFVGGSAAHGARIDSKSDFDLLGVYVPPLEEVIGIRDVPEHWVWSSAGDKVRNNPDDIDMNMYSLRKWGRMATSGNPSAIEFLFMPSLGPRSDVWEKLILPHTSIFLSSHAGLHFQKFCEHMLRTLKGEGQGKRGKRLDLIGEFGYDTKAAMHLVRVLNEGIELMETGRITLPRPEKELLVSIRKGEAGTLKDIEAMAVERFARLEAARLGSPLSPAVDMGKVSELVSMAQKAVWDETNELVLVFSKAFSVASWWISEICKLYPAADKTWESPKSVEKDILGLALELHKMDAGLADDAEA